MKRLTCRARRNPVSLLACLLFVLFAVLAAANLAGANAPDKPTRLAAVETPRRTPDPVMLAVAHHEAGIARVEAHKAAKAAAEAAAIEAARLAAEQAEAERRRVAEAAAAAERRAAEAAARNRQRAQAVKAQAVKAQAQAPESGSGRCGGSLPPCGVMRRESGGDLRIWNGRCYAPVGWTGDRAPNCPRARSSASGKWQFVRGTWGGYGGFLNAADAPESVQDERAREKWAGGAGCFHWSAC